MSLKFQLVILFISSSTIGAQVLNETIIRPLGLMEDDRLGGTIIYREPYLIISSTGDDDPEPQRGSVYIFKRNGLSWNQIQKITGPSPKPNTFFGSDLALSNSTLLIGAPNDSTNGFSRGTAYIFEKNGVNWVLKQKIFPEPDNGMLNKKFGRSIAILDSLIIVGADRDGPHFDSICGSVYIFSKKIITGCKKRKYTLKIFIIMADLEEVLF